MINNIIEKLSKSSIVSVAVSDDFCDVSLTVNVDDYEYASGNLYFGDEDQSFCIRGIDNYDIIEFFDEVIITDQYKTKQISLCFIK